MIISKTPLRISFLGGGTDIPSYYNLNEYGCVISSSIANYIYVIVKKQSEIFSEKFRLNYSETEIISDINKIKNPIIKECLKFLQIDEKLYIATIADIPASTGLGSSSSFCVGLLNALYKLKGQDVSSHRLAEEASHVEINLLKKPIGKQDQYAAAFGGLNLIKFHLNETVDINPVKINNSNFLKFQKSMMIFWSGVQRSSDTILSEQKINSTNNSKNLTKLRSLTLSLKTFLEVGQIKIESIGDLLNQGWELKKTFASKITNLNINNAYAEAIKNGAYGGKLLGAGGGGFLMLIAEPDKQIQIENVLKKFGFIKFQFDIDSLGSTVTNLY